MCKDEKGLRWLMCCLVSPDKATELQGSTLIILLGVWLLFSDTFQVSNVYIVMNSVASEKWWAVIFFTVGSVQLYAIFTDRCWLRKNILLLKGAIWCMLFIGVLYGDYRALSAPFYITFAFNAFRSFFCLSGTKRA